MTIRRGSFTSTTCRCIGTPTSTICERCNAKGASCWHGSTHRRPGRDADGMALDRTHADRSPGPPITGSTTSRPPLHVNLYDIPLRTLAGSPASLGDFRGRVLLIVNVASNCGLTAQYAGLERLH